jgi:hypothetical protein
VHEIDIYGLRTFLNYDEGGGLALKELLEKLSKEELIDFITKYAENDAKFVNAVNVHFREPEFENELYKIKNKIDDALSGVSDYRNHDSWGYVYFDVSDIVAESRQRAEQGHIKLAFSELELLYRKLLKNFEYQGECEISDEAEHCLDIMSEIADKATLVEDKDYIFKKCLVLSELEDGKDNGADYEDKLLKIAAKFVTQENRAELDKVLDCFNFSWREEGFKLIQLEIINKLENESAACAFIYENLRFPKIREIAFDKAMLFKNFAEAERLCADALSVHEQRHSISAWLYKLYYVYEASGNTAKMTETAEDILLCGDLEYYEKLKLLLKEQDAWENSYSELLQKCELKLSHSQYMEILATEKEYDLLLEQVKKHMDKVYLYGKLLAKKYPADVCEIFTEQISKEAETAYGRESYRKVCSRFQSFIEAGYKSDATEIIEDLKSK